MKVNCERWARIGYHTCSVILVILVGIYLISEHSKNQPETMYCPADKVIVKETNPASKQILFMACLNVEETHYGAQQKKTEVKQ